MTEDLYGLLGVEPGATQEEIRAAYLELARRCHPDRFATRPPLHQELAEKRMVELNLAYDVLTSVYKRQIYDDCRRQGLSYWAVEMTSAPESPAEREAREVDFSERREAALQLVHNRLLQLEEAVRWKQEEDEYFDRILSGRRERSRVRFYLKVLEEFGPSSLEGIVSYSRAVLDLTPTSLIRTELVFLMLGCRIDRPATLEKQVREHNFAHWEMPTGVAPRSRIAWVDGQDGVLHCPEAEEAWPDLSRLVKGVDQVL